MVTPDIESRINTLKGGGQPLSRYIRDFFELRFGHDFSQVRVHTGSEAAQMSSELNAHAFTVGRDIYLGAGRYSPDTSSGKSLLAHELTHVLQQSRDETTSSPLFRAKTEQASSVSIQREAASIRVTGVSVPRISRFAPTVFHPGVMHNHQPTGRWADVQEASSCFRGAIECVCAHAEPLGVLMIAYLHELEDLARRHLIHYVRGGGADLPVDLEDVIQRDVGVRAQLASAMRHSNTGWVKIEQNHYDVQDFQYAFGAIDRLDYEVDTAAGLVHVWFKDRYEFHPVGFGYESLPDDELRETNCVHAAAVELKASGAADYWMVGDAVVPVSLFGGPFTYSWGKSERQEREVF